MFKYVARRVNVAANAAMLPLRNVVYKHKAFELARDGITPGQIADVLFSGLR